MNRPLIITIGAAIILTILGVWLYLMLFGTPENGEEVFTNLGFSLTPQGTTITPPPASTPIENLVDTNTGSLRQLTTRPVAGFVSFVNEAGEAVVRYAERGTGYVYEINLASGSETIVSRTTVPQVAEAVFSTDGSHLTLTSYQGYTKTTRAGAIVEANFDSIDLEPGAENFHWKEAGILNYSVVQNGMSIGYEQNLETESRAEVFRFAFTSLRVVWNGDDAYVIPRPGRGVSGTVYRISGSTVNPVTEGGTFFTAVAGEDNFLVSRVNGSSYQTSFTRGTSSVPMPLVALPEKCTGSSNNAAIFWCAAPIDNPTAADVENWYKGVSTFNDRLWLLNTSTQTAQLVASPEALLSRSLDITDLSTYPNSTFLLFKNRGDQTLWLYDLLTS